MASTGTRTKAISRGAKPHGPNVRPFCPTMIKDMKTYTRIALLLAAALPVALFASSPNDGKIQDAAKNSYNFRTVLNDHVTASVDDGVVTLTGTVQDKDDKALAEDTVENLPGVVRVDNQIAVKSDYPEHSDEWIALKIRSTLLVKANVSATATTVNVKDGVVTLTGTAINGAQRDLTEAYAKDIDHVKSVRNEMVVEASPPVASTVGETIDDASITSQVKFALLSHSSTSALSTKVITENAVVSITGVAKSDAEKSLVTKLAQDTRGVKSVVNNMTVKS
jgi:hyperosmotically inducible periplasmic protein